MRPSITSQPNELRIAPLADYQRAAVFNPYEHFAFFGSVGAGKTFCGAHWCINNRLTRPGNEFLVAANSYDQMSQATLAELFYWLEEYGFEYVQDRRPPSRFGRVPSQKNYRNTLTIYDPRCGKASMGYTRVLSSPDNLRGIEFEDYWIDEARDTTQYAHDMILGRQRGYDKPRGFISTTTNGEDWVYKRFNPGSQASLFGSMNVDINQSVRSGVLTAKYRDTLMASYSELMAQQELFAKHVNIHGGRAYYATGDWNRQGYAPWGDRRPNHQRPLIVGCDFNFQPAPCVWVVGQVGPDILDPREKNWAKHIHWFREIASVQTSTESMTLMLINQFPGFFYRIFGDASGNRGTTSNAGQTDFNRMANVLSDNGAMFTIDVEQANPLVKDRVENVNAIAKNGMGEIRMTYDSSGCPLLDGDMRMVGWKDKTNSMRSGQGHLDTGGDNQRTHASDAIGYATFKLFPPGRRARIIDSVPSLARQRITDEIQGNNIAQGY